ncbi:MAG: NnrS family protein [Gammaproteobacteria bacterium]|nr:MULTISPECIES: NnrS family protein [unclassified Moraxella]NOX78392.1 NnrS family protein [Gammaproteobacteria bacterium]NPA77850.1 NnrS family protein [Gammaproteobacteria bacterium]
MQQIRLPNKPPYSPHPVLNLGFRIFFLGAAVFAILTMLKWAYITFATRFEFDGTNQMMPFYWHGHEMLYGYALAVIAGFLLTAVKAWTQQSMPYGYKLLVIFVPWALARVLFLANGININTGTLIAAASDIIFWLLTASFVILPIYRVRQKRQIGIVAKLLLLFIGQVWFYVALFTQNNNGMHMSLLFGLYLIVGVVLTIGRRVMPMFIEHGIATGGEVRQKVKNSDLLDRLSLLGFFAFMLSDVFLTGYRWAVCASGTAALVIAISNLIRLKNWYLPEIWSKPLLWSLWLSFFGMVIGFFLFVLVPFGIINHSLAMHAVVISGIGLMTLAMMSRVSLGHTGRNIHQPPKTVTVIFISMTMAWLARAVLGWILPDYYFATLAMAQAFWIVAFLVFVASYAPILTLPRTDKLFG